MKISALATLLLAASLCVEGAQILGIFHFHSKSHHILGSALLKALAARGHQVTMLSPYPLKTPVKNYEDIELTGILEYAAKNGVRLMELQNMSGIQRMSMINSHIQIINEMFLNHTAVHDLLNSARKFDLVIQIWFFNAAHIAIADHFKAPVVVFNTHIATASANTLTGNPSPYAYIPFLYSSYPTDMTFFQRVGNTMLHLASAIEEHLINQPRQEELFQKYFPLAPPLQDLLNNVSLVLLNSHFSIENPRPYLPNMIPVGGMHVEDPDELTGELQSFLDSATEGVVYFSLGTNLKIGDMSKEKLQGILNAFGKLPLTVLWKFESDSKPNLPSNVKIAKWFPQKEILAHRNTKVFVTHGGMLSTTEAVYFGVPIVGIPFFADQHHNIADCVNNGYAVQLSYDGLSEKTLATAIIEVFTNSKYRENIKIRSLALKDQPLKPMDTAVYWIEYVLRHKGAHYLRASAIKMKWYQYFLVDVVAFVTGSLFIILFLMYITGKVIVKLILKVCRKVKTE